MMVNHPNRSARKALEGLVREKDEEIDGLQQALSDLADRMEYHGNSISWIHSKARANGDALLEAWKALTDAGVLCDGKTTVADGIRQLAKRLPAKPLTL